MQALALLITNAIKLAGLAVAVFEVFGHSTTRPEVLGLAAFMMAGAQLSETFFAAFLDRFFQKPESESSR